MNLYTLLRKGESHPVYCEDFAITHEDEAQCVVAVFDGCSSGTESHFASALLGKIIRKNASHRGLKNIFKHAFQDLKDAVATLALEEEEVLATALVACYDKQKQTCEILVVGDGFVLLNEEWIEIDQQNTPDYWGYYVKDTFEAWWKRQKNVYTIQNPTRVVVSTDGIDTFKSFQTDLPADFNPVQYLLFDDQWKHLPNMLYRKCTVLDKKYGFLPYDDIGIVMMIFE